MDGIRRLKFVLLTSCLVLGLSSVTDCYPSYRNSIPNGCYVTNPCNTSEIWCGVGHQSKYGGGARNPFGLDFAANNHIWNATICEKDSDGDGLTNGQELGDPNCTWSQGSSPTCNCDPTFCECGSPRAGITHPGICEPLDHPRCLQKNSWLTCPVDFDCPDLNNPSVVTERLMVPGAAILPQLTTYVCRLVPLPNNATYDLIGTTPYLENYELVHHMILFGCRDLPQGVQVGTTFYCTINPPCLVIFANYDKAQPFDCLPPEFGFRIGSNTDIQYAIVQIHYNNPTYKSGVIDNSGMTIYLNPNLRPNAGGVMTAGQLKLAIPPGLPNVVRTGSCTTGCGLPRQPVNITRLFLHMHLLGRSANVSQYRNGALLRQLLVNQPYDFNLPMFNFVEPFVEYLPGDELRLDCAYDSTSRTCTTYYGQETTNEMCYVLVTYYPVQPRWDDCVQYDTNTVCTDYFLVPGCDSQALNDTISSIGACNLLVVDVCHSTCMTNIINKLRSIGCLKDDVRDLLVLYLEQQTQQQAANAVNLIWQCAGMPSTNPPSGCLTTTKQTVKTTPKPTKTTKKPAKKHPKKPKSKPKKPHKSSKKH